MNMVMSNYKMKLAKGPFERVARGSKVLESRLYDEKRKQLNPGDRIEFICNDDESKRVAVMVKALYRYSKFEELFSDFSPSLFGGSLKQELINEINSFYSLEDQEKHGVVGIRIELLK